MARPGERAADRGLARVADVDDLDRRDRPSSQRGDVGGRAGGGLTAASSGRSASTRLDVGDLAGHVVEADAGEPDLGLDAPAGVAEQDDLLAGPDDVAGVLGEAAVEADVDRPAEVAGRERLRRAGVEQRPRPSRPSASASSTVSCGGRLVVVEQLALAAVGVGGEREVERRHALALGDGVDELRPRSSARGRSWSRAARRWSTTRRSTGACRTPSRRRGPGRPSVASGKGEELVVQGAVEVAGEAVGGAADGGEQVGPADVADEQRVAGEHGPRLGVGVLADDDRDRLGRVARGVADLQGDLAERQPLAVGERVDREVGAGHVAVGDGGAGRLGQLEVAGEEVGVEVGLDDPLDRAARAASASARYSLMSRCGSTTTARPVVVSPIR